MIQRIAPLLCLLAFPLSAATITVSSANDSGPGTLRQAILDVNALGAGPHTIRFDIAPGGLQTITPLSPLPALTASSTTLDATTQPGDSAAGLIELAGESAGPLTSGLTISGASARVRGFVINGFATNGIVITAPDVEVTNNYIGVDAGGTAQKRNRFNGISIASSGATITGNTIAWNLGVGVEVVGVGHDRNSIRRNSIFSNIRRGIALGPLGGGLHNDPRDADTGYANQGQNHPVLSSAVWSAGVLTMTGTLNSIPLTTFDLDFYANETCYEFTDAQGKTWRHTMQVTTNANGDAPIDVSFEYPGTGFITATATHRDRTETSEFSPCRVVINALPSVVQFQSPTLTVKEGDEFATLIVTRTGSTAGPATVEFMMIDGSAHIPSDYLPPASTLVTWGDGDGSPKEVKFPIIADNFYERPEDFQVLLRNASGATLGAVENALVTIEESLTGPPPPADMSIGVYTRSGGAEQGSPLSYQIIVTNQGPNDAREVVMTNVLPPQLLFAELREPNGWTCTTPAPGTNGTIRCTTPVQTHEGPLGSTTYFNLSTNVAFDAVGSIVNQVSVSHAGTDPNPDNSIASSSATEVVEVIADVSVTKSTTAVNAAIGSAFTYTITVTNSGPNIAAAVTLTDVLPAQLQFLSRNIIQPSGDLSCTTPGYQENGTITCSAYRLPPGTTATLQLGVRVAPGAALGPMTNTASIVSPNMDPSTADHSATSAAVEILPGADLSLHKGATALVARENTLFTYTLSIQNSGPSDATDVVVTDVLPEGLLFDAVTPTGSFTCTTPAVGTNGTVRCTAPLLRANVVGGPLIRVRVAPGVKSGSVVNRATVTSTTLDPDYGDTTGVSPAVTLEPSAGVEHRVDPATPAPRVPQTAPDVATGQRNALAVWREGTVGTSPPTGPVSIRGAVFRPDADGDNVLEIAASQPGTDVTYPVVAAAGDRYLVVWRESKSSQGRLLARRIRDDGTFIDATPLVLESGAAVLCCSQLGDPRPAVASNGRDFFVTWVSHTSVVRGVVVPAAGPVLNQTTIVSRESDSESRGHYDLEVVWTSAVYVVFWLDQVFRIEPPIQEPYVLRYARVTSTGVVLDAVSEAIDAVIYSSITAASLSDGAVVTVDYEELSQFENNRRHCIGVLLMTAIGEPRDAYSLRCENEPIALTPTLHAKLLPISTGFLLVQPGRRYEPIFRDIQIRTSNADPYFNTLSPASVLGPPGQEVEVASWQGKALFVYNRADRDASGTSVPRVFSFLMGGESGGSGRRRSVRH